VYFYLELYWINLYLWHVGPNAQDCNRILQHTCSAMHKVGYVAEVWKLPDANSLVGEIQ